MAKERLVSTTLYRCHGGGGALLYVGIADIPTRRWREHDRSSVWWDDVRSITTEVYGDRESALAAEEAAIRRERPLHNVVHNGPPLREVGDALNPDAFDLIADLLVLGKLAYSTAGAASVLDVTPSTVLRWIAEGQLPVLDLPTKSRMVAASDLVAFVRAHRRHTQEAKCSV